MNPYAYFHNFPVTAGRIKRIRSGSKTAASAIIHMAAQRGDSQMLSIRPPEMISVCRKDLSITGPRTSPTTSGAGAFTHETLRTTLMAPSILSRAYLKAVGSSSREKVWVWMILASNLF